MRGRPGGGPRHAAHHHRQVSASCQRRCAATDWGAGEAAGRCQPWLSPRHPHRHLELGGTAIGGPQVSSIHDAGLQAAVRVLGLHGTEHDGRSWWGEVGRAPQPAAPGWGAGSPPCPTCACTAAACLHNCWPGSSAPPPLTLRSSTGNPARTRARSLTGSSARRMSLRCRARLSTARFITPAGSRGERHHHRCQPPAAAATAGGGGRSSSRHRRRLGRSAPGLLSSAASETSGSAA